MKKILLVVFAISLLLIPVSAQALSIGMWGSWATIGQQFNDRFAGYLGYSYWGASPGHNTENYFLGKVDLNLAKLGEVQTKVGLYCWGDTPNTESEIGLTYGISTMVKPNLSVGADISLMESYSTGGTSSLRIIPEARAVINLYL